MINKRCFVPLFVLVLGALGSVCATASAQPGGQRAAYAQDRDAWDAAPHEWKESQRRGFQDGIEGARKDFGNNRRPDVNNREEYRHPTLPYDQREPYREGFRRGYERAISHLTGDRGNQQREPEPSFREHRGRDLAQDMQQRGFEEGMEGARKDFGNHRRADVNNREEYRHPAVAYELQHAYREGFKRGYEKSVSEMTGGRGRP